jgi:hypothetical protein
MTATAVPSLRGEERRRYPEKPEYPGNNLMEQHPVRFHNTGNNLLILDLIFQHQV